MNKMVIGVNEGVETPASASTDIQIEFINTVGGLLALEAEWKALEQCVADPFNYFQTHDWCRAWSKIFLAQPIDDDAPSLLIATVRTNGILAAVIPKMIHHRSLGVSVMKFLGEPLLQYGGLIADPALVDIDTVCRAIAEMETEANCDAHVLERFIAGSPLCDALGDNLRFEINDHLTSVVDLSLFDNSDAFLASHSKSARKSRRRRRKVLDEMGHLEFLVIDPSHPSYCEWLDLTMNFKREWLAETGRRPTNISDPKTAAFLKELAGDVSAKEGVILMALTLDGTPIATEIGFCHYGHYYSFLGAFNWQMREYSPGKVQIEAAICWAIDSGLDTFDFLGSPTSFKKDWSNREIALAGYAQGKTVKGRLYAHLWKPTVKPAVKAAFLQMPSSVRRPLMGVARAFGTI